MRCGYRLVMITLLIFATPVLARTWTDSTGKHKIDGDFVELAGKTVHIKKSDGKLLKMPLARLSAADRKFVEEQAGGEASGESAVAPAGSSVSKASVDGVTLEVVSVSVAKPLPEENVESNKGNVVMSGGMHSPGTRIGLLVSDPARQLVGIDEAKSQLTITADRGELSKPAKKDSDFIMDKPLQFAARADGHSGVLQLTQPGIPAAGCGRLLVKGDVHVQCGVGEKIDEQKDVALKPGTQLTVGPMPLKIESADAQDFGDSKMMVTLTAAKPLSAIKKFMFLSADGKEIPSHDAGSGNFGFGAQMTYSRSFALKEKVDAATIRIVGFEKLDTLKVPVDLAVGVGL